MITESRESEKGQKKGGCYSRLRVTTNLQWSTSATMKRFQDPGRALRRLEWIEAIIMGYDPGAAQVESRPAHQLAVRPKCAGPRKQLDFYSASLQRSLSHHQRITTHTSHRHALAREARR
jgi:hypothetical protein